MIYNKNLFQAFITIFLSAVQPMTAQGKYAIHSHNDYAQDYPFWKAYVNGAASIEADVYLQNDTLYVTHSPEEIKPGKTLENLYLDPLIQLNKKGELQEIQLLIDIKSEARPTLKKLQNLLEKHPKLIQNQVFSVVISGNRPEPVHYSEYPDYILFDHQNMDDLDSINLEKIGLISQNFKNYSFWNGLGRLTEMDLQKVEEVIARVHAKGKKIRFWASPDTRTAWSRFAKLGVDYINTDQPGEAAAYLATIDERSFNSEDLIPIYKPEFNFKQDQKPANVILMIGDGNGLNQISSAMIANGGTLTLTQLKEIGLIKTASADDLVTDSAAGATAIATGKKTNNRAIGTDPDGKTLKNITEILSANGYINGLLTTDKITGATPASFYAHVVERDNREQILEDLTKSSIDFFVSAGQDDYSEIEQLFKQRELDGINDFKQRSAVFLSEGSIPEAQDRGDIFPEHVRTVLSKLSAQPEPYFLMIEAAKIDSNGHSNSIEGIVREMLDFDKVIAEVLKNVDKNPNTLVLITADHETSGMGILQGDENIGIEAGFLTHDHTATMVPLFAYGPGSSNFSGIYENNEIFKKLMEVLEIEK